MKIKLTTGGTLSGFYEPKTFEEVYDAKEVVLERVDRAMSPFGQYIDQGTELFYPIEKVLINESLFSQSEEESEEILKRIRIRR